MTILKLNAGTYVSVANKGAADLQSRVETEKHKRETSSAKLTNFFVKPGSKVEDNTGLVSVPFPPLCTHGSSVKWKIV